MADETRQGYAEITRRHWKLMTLVGAYNPSCNKFYVVYVVLIVILCHLSYPTFIAIQALIVKDNTSSFIEQCFYVLVLVICSIKLLLYLWRFENFDEIKGIFDFLDNKLDQIEYADHVEKCKKISIIHFFLYGSVYVTSIISLIFLRERKLLQPAWFPFDWENSFSTYMALIGYELFAGAIMTTTNAINDSFQVVFIGMITSHLEFLIKRVTRIGHDLDSKNANPNTDLTTSVLDFQMILKQFKIIDTTISTGLFLQLQVANFICCSSVVLLIFFVDDYFKRVYFALFFLAGLLQVFIICYFGCAFTQNVEDLGFALYSCNWINQDQSFKRSVLIFMQGSSRKAQFTAGGITVVSLETFVNIVKSAYSLFAILRQYA